ncbi:MAG: GNAT family N-acetyltransferase [Hyphomicrobium sp.]
MSAGVKLRQAARSDASLIRSWLVTPDIQEWWGPLSSTEAEVNIALSSDHAICRIIECDGEAVGYCHAIDASMWGDALPDELEPGTWDLDIFVASERHRGLGIGQIALAALKDEVFSTTLAVAVCVFPSIRNERAVRAYEKAGFKWKRIWNDPHAGPSWFMVAERTTN